METTSFDHPTEEATSRSPVLFARRATDRDLEKHLHSLRDALRAARSGDFPSGSTPTVPAA